MAVLLPPVHHHVARAVEVHDGDTFNADLDLDFHIWWRNVPFRLLGVNAIELEDPGGTEARDNLAGLLLPWVVLTSVKPDKYGGRWDAVVTLADGTDLARLLVGAGWAAPWTGAGPKPVPPWPRVQVSTNAVTAAPRSRQ